MQEERKHVFYSMKNHSVNSLIDRATFRMKQISYSHETVFAIMRFDTGETSDQCLVPNKSPETVVQTICDAVMANPGKIIATENLFINSISLLNLINDANYMATN